MTTYAIPVPPRWTTRPAGDSELLRAGITGAQMRAELRLLTDPRRSIPRQVQDEVGAPVAVTTTYRDTPLGRAILAEAGSDRAAAQLWIPLPDRPEALVITVTVEAPERVPAAAYIAGEIGARLAADGEVVRRFGTPPPEEDHSSPACLAS